MLVSITAPNTNQRGPQHMERVFSSILDSMDRHDRLQLVFASHQGRAGIFCRFADHLRDRVVSHFQAKYPNCAVHEIDETALDPPPKTTTWSSSLRLTPEIFPILRHKQFQDMLDGALEDPLESLLGALRPSHGLRPQIEITVRPAGRLRRLWAKGAVKRLDRSFFRSHHLLSDFYARHISGSRLMPFAFLLGLLAARDCATSHQTDSTSSRYGDREDDVQAAADKIGGNLFQATIELSVAGATECHAAARTKLRIMRGAFGAFTKSRLATFRMSPVRRRRQRRMAWRIFAHEELATLFHPATATVRSEGLATLPFRELEPPVAFAARDGNGGVSLGRVRYRSDDRTFGIATADRCRHLYVVGRTGVGKTTLLETLIRADVAAGRGVCLIDPHGDLAARVIASIPTHRTNDVIVFDPCDRRYAVGFNPLAARPGRADRVTSAVVTSFKKIYDSWGPRLEDTLRNTIYLAVEHGGTLFDVLRLLTDDAERNRLLAAGACDELSYRFWTSEFARWNDRYRTEAVAAILNKVRPFLMNRNVRAVVSQPKPALDLRRAMDEGKILVANVSKGQLGEDNANLLGALLVASIQQAAMSRAELPERDRRDFYLYIDEFQNFSTESFADILSEARKYRLAMTLAHQYTRQLDDATADAIFGNVGSMVVFQVGGDDAETLTRQLRKYPDQIAPEDLTNIPKYHAYCRLLQNGMPEHPFSMATLAPPTIEQDRSAIVRRASNEKYARPRAAVLAELSKSGPAVCLPEARFVPRPAATGVVLAGSLQLSR